MSPEYLDDFSNENYALCWRFTITTVIPKSVVTIYVNALTGDIHTQKNPIVEDHHTGSLETWYDGPHSDIITWRQSFLQRFETAQLDMKLSVLNNLGKTYKDWNNNWVEQSSNQMTGSTAYWALLKSYNYFNTRFGRAGSDQNNKQVQIWAQRTDAQMGGAANAAFDPTVTNFDKILLRADNTGVTPPNGSKSGFGYSAAILDIVGHEYSHALINGSSELGNLQTFEAMSLSEGFADIFGMTVEKHVYGYSDWSFGEKTGQYRRYFQDPSQDYGIGTSTGNSCVTYLQNPLWFEYNKYSSSGVLRKWFYLLANGGSANGQTVSGIGYTKAENIAYHAMTWWMWSNIGFTEAAHRIADGARDLYGNCSKEHQETMKAFRAVGFNLPIYNCWIIDISGPSVVDRKSAKIISYKIKFGDPNIKPGGTYDWIVPSGWTVTRSGDVLTLDATTNYDSKVLVGKYTDPDGEIFLAEKVVHFSDETFTPNNHFIFKPINFGEEEVDLSTTILYPNPASYELNILLPYGVSDATIEIMNLDGRVVKTQSLKGNSGTVLLENVASGLYPVVINAAGKRVIKKVSVIK